MTASRILAALTLLALLALLAFIGLIVPAAASAQDGGDTLSARIAALRSHNETIRFCVELSDGQTERVCPQRSRLRFADAPDGTWLQSEWFFIAPETSLRIRARRVGDRLEFGLQLNADGTRPDPAPTSAIPDLGADADRSLAAVVRRSPCICPRCRTGS